MAESDSPRMLDGIIHSSFEFNGHLTKFTVIKEAIETFPGGRVATGGLVQPVWENCLTTLFVILSLCPHLKLLPGKQQVTNVPPLVNDRAL